MVLDPKIEKRVAVEAGSKLGWEKWVGTKGAIVGMSSYGASAPAETLFKEFGFTSTMFTKQQKDYFKEDIMRIVVGCDHAGFPIKDAVIEAIKSEGHEVLDVGTFSKDRVDFPDFAGRQATRS